MGGGGAPEAAKAWELEGRHIFLGFNFDGFVKSPFAALRFNFVVAEGRGGSPSRPISVNPAGCPYHRICLHRELFTRSSIFGSLSLLPQKLVSTPDAPLAKRTPQGAPLSSRGGEGAKKLNFSRHSGENRGPVNC